MEMNKSSGVGTLVYETYGEVFGYYPKILNWSLIEMEANIDVIKNDINDKHILRCWTQYFDVKKRKLVDIPRIQQTRVNQIIFEDFIKKYSASCPFLIHNPKCYRDQTRKNCKQIESVKSKYDHY